MKFDICKLLDIRYPVFQGGMAWVADGELAAAVSEAGGLGLIAGGQAEAHIVEKEIKKAKSLTDKPFGVNVMLLSPHADEVAQLLCEEKVSVVTTGAGNPSKYMKMYQDNNIKVIPVVPSVAMAKLMERMGADGVIAEGMESGGHVGKLTTMALLPQVVSAVNIPVIGAGGIGDGRGMAAAFMLGACGVQLGTRFVVAKECNVHDNYKQAILKANDIATAVTGDFTGHPVRVIRNKLCREMQKLEQCSPLEKEENIRKFEELGAGALRKAVTGDAEYGSVMSGQIAGMINKEQTCSEIIEELVRECRETIRDQYEIFK